MGLLSDVIGGVLGGSASSSPLGNILTSILAGRGNNPAAGGGAWNTGGGGGLPSGLPGSLGGLAGSIGGLGGLINMFNQAGLGQVAQSWVGNGANLPVTPEQLRDVLGHKTVEEMATHAGMDQGGFLEQLSQHLPNVVSGLTPDGRLPDEGKISV